MDIFSHGLWTAAAAKVAGKKLHPSLHAGWAAFWGVFPDLLAFTLPFALLFWNMAVGNLNISDFPRPDPEGGAPSDAANLFNSTLVHALYSLSHSIIIFAVVFCLVWLLKKRPVWELLGWLLHILIDIPTHSYQFYPTPFLWPVSNLKINGVSWATPWFMVANYFALLAVYAYLRFAKRKTSC